MVGELVERAVERAATQVEDVMDECFVVQVWAQVRARAVLVPKSYHTHVQSARLALVR